MIALLAAMTMTLFPVQSQQCGAYGVAGPNVGHVYWIGGPSADLAPIGGGSCTGTAWIDPLGVEVAVPGEGDLPELYVDGEQRGPDLNGNGDA